MNINKEQCQELMEKLKNKERVVDPNWYNPVLIGDCLQKLQERHQEKFVPVVGYEGLYEVGDMGNIKSLVKSRTWNPKTLTPTTSSNGNYSKVNLTKDGKHKTIMVHKIMQVSFKLGMGEIDHINGIGTDNRLSNLRVCTSKQNKHNSKAYGKSLYKGVSWSSSAKKWQARITRDGESTNLGLFDNEEEAAAAYMKKAQKTDGEFFVGNREMSFDSSGKSLVPDLLFLWMKCGFSKSIQTIVEEKGWEEERLCFSCKKKECDCVHVLKEINTRLKSPEAAELIGYLYNLFIK